VISVSTPRHKLIDPWERWKKQSASVDKDKEITEGDDDDDERSVILQCAYIDFDGKKFGPVSMKFKIREYNGSRDVRSLPLYPFRYAKNPDLESKLIRRAKMLLDVTNFKPMYYTGPTLDTGEEIDSQVVIDCTEALNSCEQRQFWQPPIKPTATSLLYDTLDIENSCRAPCCENQAVNEGTGVDQYLSRRFITKQLSRSTTPLILSPKPLEEMNNDPRVPADDELIVMTYRVFGFVLRSRKWGKKLSLPEPVFQRSELTKHYSNA
jgi:hypothetical protein